MYFFYGYTLSSKIKIEMPYITEETFYEYLKCYALDQESKKICHDQLRQIHVNSHFRSDEKYAQRFAHSAERIGFENALNRLNTTCRSINNGPLYNKRKEAYEVICTSGEKYLMKFDYELQTWNLVD